jgi:hypothetical protein
MATLTNKFCVDANIFITAWDSSYPISVFPTLWGQLARFKDNIVIIKPVYDEINPISPADRKLDLSKKREKYPLRMWLEDNQFTETLIDDMVENLSLKLELEYEIDDISKGASQNDITLITYAKINNKTVVTLEAIQPEKPKYKKNYKIPLICKEQNVICINFIKMLSQLSIKI